MNIEVGSIVKMAFINLNFMQIGVVVGIHEGTWPKDWIVNDGFALGRRVDVLWQSGVLVEDIAECTLEIVNEVWNYLQG